METKRNFANYQQVSPSDLNAIQSDVETSIDNIVQDTLIPGRGYSGFAISKTGPAQVTLNAGRLYVNGKVYALNTSTQYDFTTVLPVASQKIVQVVLNGIEQDSNVQAVNFLSPTLSTPTNPVYQPQSVATDHVRVASIAYDVGTESPAPSAPSVDASLLAIATIVLGTTGVVSVANITSAEVPNLQDHETRVEALENFEAQVGPEIKTLASALAALSNQANASSLRSALTRAFLGIAALDAKTGIPSGAADASMDYLLDGSNCDLTNVLSSCKVMEGIRFPDDGADTSVFNVFNPFDPNAEIKNGFLFPAYARYLRSTTGPKTNVILANSYTYSAVDYTQQTVTQQRTSYGTPFDVCTNSSFWQSGSYNPLTGIFTLPDGETYQAAFDSTAGVGYLNDLNGISHVYMRLQQFWTDSISTTYWDAVVQAPQTINGYHLFESFLNGQDQWIDAIGVQFGNLAATGDVTLVITEAGDNAQPDPSLVLATVNVPFASLVGNSENVFALVNPVLLASGKRYSVGIVTAAGHEVGTTDGANFPQGTFFQLAPSGFAAGDLTKHLCLNFYGCKFNNSVVSIQLQNLQLAGGMCGIQILAPTIVPDSTTLVYEIQLAGIWVSLNAQTVGQLNAGGALPPNVPIRVTMAGTQDMMPALNLSQSQVTVSRPATSFANVWPKNARTPPVSATTIGVIQEYDGYDTAFHSAGVKLLTGAGLTTETSPSSVTSAIDANGNTVVTYVFNLGAAVTSYKVLTQGNTMTPLNTFLVANTKDYSF